MTDTPDWEDLNPKVIAAFRANNGKVGGFFEDSQHFPRQRPLHKARNGKIFSSTKLPRIPLRWPPGKDG
jgi:hypothetical protein